MALRWRMLYLERRAALLQQRAVKPAVAAAPIETPSQAPTPDPDRWRWRARYLESRVRHLEQAASGRPIEPVAHANGAEAETAAPAPLVPAGAEERPPSLPAATAGAPDDFTLIDGVSPLQQSTLYSLGIYHFDQIAAWTPANVAWVDKFLRLRGRIGEEEWVEQAGELAQFGVHAARGQGEGARA
jgi:predicted flap endonuclease-1-like 5' DNA nuclease